MPPKKPLTERERAVLSNKNDTALRHVRNVIEELDEDENVPDSGQVYMYIKKEHLPNFFYYKYRFKSRARQMLMGARKNRGAGLMNTLKHDLLSQVKANREKAARVYDKSTSYFMHSAEHLREYHNKYEPVIHGVARQRRKEDSPMPVELFSTTTRQTYGLPVQTMTVPIDGHPNWGEAMEAEIIEQERLNPSRPKPLELDPNTNMWKLDVPVRTDRVIRGAGGAMREVPQTPNIITQRPDRFDLAPRKHSLKTEGLGDDNSIPHSGQAYMYTKKKEPPFFYRGRWQNMGRALLGDALKRQRFNRVISKPTKPKPAYIKGVTDKGFNVAFYVESSEGTQATPTKRFMLPIDSPDKEIVSLTKERPKTWKVDEGVREMPRHTLRVPNELVALDRLPRVHYVKQPRLDEIFRPIDSNRPVEYMPAETLDPAKDIREPELKNPKSTKNDVGYWFKGPKGMDINPYERTERNRIPPVRTWYRKPQNYASLKLPTSAQHSARQDYQIQPPASDIRKIKNWKARENEHEYFHHTAGVQTDAPKESVNVEGGIEEIQSSIRNARKVPNAEAGYPDFNAPEQAMFHNRGNVKDISPTAITNSEPTHYDGTVPKEQAQKRRIDTGETISSTRHVPHSSMVYMYERPRKPEVYYKDGKFVPRDQNKLWFSEWTAKQARVHKKSMTYGDAISRSSIDPTAQWRSMYAHPLQNQKHPTYAIYSYDEEGLHELPFREDYEIKPENPDNLTIKRVIRREPGYEKDGAGYNWEAPSAVEYTPDENLDYEKVPKVAQRSARDEKYLGSPYQASQATQYEFHDSISPQQTIGVTSTSKPLYDKDTEILRSVGTSTIPTTRGLTDQTQPTPVYTDKVTSDKSPMYNYDIPSVRRVDTGETLDPSQNIRLIRYNRGRGQINEGPVDDTAHILQYWNTRETLDPKMDLQHVTPTPGPDEFEGFYMPPKYPIVADTISRTPREHALWNTPKRVRQQQARDEVFDDPLRYHRPQTQGYMMRQTLDPSADTKKIPQVPLYTYMYPTAEDIESGRHAYVDYRGKPWNRYTFSGYDDVFGEDDEEAFVNPNTDDAPAVPTRRQHMVYKHHGVSVNAEEKQKPYIQKYYEYYEGPLEKGVKTFYEQPFGKAPKKIDYQSHVPLEEVNPRNVRHRANSMIFDTRRSTSSKVPRHRAKSQPPVSTLDGPNIQKGAWVEERASMELLARSLTGGKLSDEERSRKEQDKLERELQEREERALLAKLRADEEEHLAELREEEEAAERRRLSELKRKLSEKKRALEEEEERRRKISEERRLQEEEQRRLEEEAHRIDDEEHRRLSEERWKLEEAEERLRQEEERRRLSNERRLSEERIKLEEAEEKLRKDEERRRLSDERRRQEEEDKLRLVEEQRRLSEERRKVEENLRLEEERRQISEEMKKQEEEARLKLVEEQRRLSDERRRLEEAEESLRLEEERRRLSDERRRHEERRRRLSDERQKQEEEDRLRLAEEQRRKLSAEERRRVEEEERRRKEQEDLMTEQEAAEAEPVDETDYEELGSFNSDASSITRLEMMQQQKASEERRRMEQENLRQLSEQRRLAEERRQLEEAEEKLREDERQRQEEEDRLRLAEEERRKLSAEAAEERRRVEEEDRRLFAERQRKQQESLRAEQEAAEAEPVDDDSYEGTGSFGSKDSFANKPDETMRREIERRRAERAEQDIAEAVPVDDDYEYEYPDAEDGTRHSYKALDNYSPKQTRISTASTPLSDSFTDPRLEMERRVADEQRIRANLLNPSMFQDNISETFYEDRFYNRQDDDDFAFIDQKNKLKERAMSIAQEESELRARRLSLEEHVKSSQLVREKLRQEQLELDMMAKQLDNRDQDDSEIQKQEEAKRQAELELKERAMTIAQEESELRARRLSLEEHVKSSQAVREKLRQEQLELEMMAKQLEDKEQADREVREQEDAKRRERERIRAILTELRAEEAVPVDDDMLGLTKAQMMSLKYKRGSEPVFSDAAQRPAQTHQRMKSLEDGFLSATESMQQQQRMKSIEDGFLSAAESMQLQQQQDMKSIEDGFLSAAESTVAKPGEASTSEGKRKKKKDSIGESDKDDKDKKKKKKDKDKSAAADSADEQKDKKKKKKDKGDKSIAESETEPEGKSKKKKKDGTAPEEGKDEKKKKKEKGAASDSEAEESATKDKKKKKDSIAPEEGKDGKKKKKEKGAASDSEAEESATKDKKKKKDSIAPEDGKDEKKKKKEKGAASDSEAEESATKDKKKKKEKLAAEEEEKDAEQSPWGESKEKKKKKDKIVSESESDGEEANETKKKKKKEKESDLESDADMSSISEGPAKKKKDKDKGDKDKKKK